MSEKPEYRLLADDPALGLTRPGDLFSYVDNRGVLRTERWGEQPTATYPKLTWWRRTLRAMTPPRFRKPLKPVWNDPVSRAMRLNEDTLQAIQRLTEQR